MTTLTKSQKSFLQSLSNEFQIRFIVLDENDHIHEIAAEELPLYVSLFDEMKAQ